MVSMFSALPHAINTMKNTTDDADHIINVIIFIVVFLNITNPDHSHSIINKPFLSITFNGLLSC